MEIGMAEANRLLATQNTACMFVTMFHGVLDLSSGVLRYCNAGHNQNHDCYYYVLHC